MQKLFDTRPHRFRNGPRLVFGVAVLSAVLCFGIPVRQAAAAPAAVPPATADFAEFWRAFSDAARRGDAKAIRALTRFPFMIGGEDVRADRFDFLWSTLFGRPIRKCLAETKPMSDQDLMEAFCGGSIYIFSRDADGWRFSEIGADD